MCEKAEKSFGNDDTPMNNGSLTVRWILNKQASNQLSTANRAYQREKVAVDAWKQAILRTILQNKKFAGIPEVHVRVMMTLDGNNRPSYTYELIDGQQRITAILAFFFGGITLPKDMVVEGADGVFHEVGGMSCKDLQGTHPEIYETLLNYRISCKWYELLSDAQTAYLFIHVLNNVNDMKPQEIRNAILGVYSDFVRETTRFNKHDLFSRMTIEKGNTKKEVLKHFSPKFALRGRMEADEWMSELIYLWKHDPESGINHKQHFDWVSESQMPAGEYGNGFTDEAQVNKLLNFALKIVKAVPRTQKHRLNPMISMMLVLYGNQLEKENGTIIPQNYVKAFFDTYDRWSDTRRGKKLYENRTMGVGDKGKKQMPPFSELFGGKNSNAIKTIFKVLDEEKDLNPASFGILNIDKRKTFKPEDILKKLEDQDGKCFYTGVMLGDDDIAGDHYIPRSEGIEAGGLTEYSNLVVCSKFLNNKKSNMSPKAFEKLIATVEEDLKS